LPGAPAAQGFDGDHGQRALGDGMHAGGGRSVCAPPPPYFRPGLQSANL
jgi:hypothetical protein